MAGHVDTRQGPAVFYHLGELRRGNTVEVDRADGDTAIFSIDAIEVYRAERFPDRRVYGAAKGAELRLITCGAGFDEVEQRYRGNVVAFAHLTGRRPAAHRTDDMPPPRRPGGRRGGRTALRFGSVGRTRGDGELVRVRLVRVRRGRVGPRLAHQDQGECGGGQDAGGAAQKPADIALVKASRAASADPWSPEASARANASEIDSRACSGAESGIAPV